MRRPGIFAPAGIPNNADLMLSWRPGAVTCYYDYLQPNKVFAYKAQNPSVKIIVRFQHPRSWWQNPEQMAVNFGQQVASRWDELQPLDPYVCFANELNLYYENGDQAATNQVHYESEQFYQKIGSWIERTAQIIKDQAPAMKLITPPFSAGRHEDGAPDEQGQISEPFAGYDYLANAVRTYFDNTLAIHAYWGDINGSDRNRLYDPQLASWYAFRWRRLLKLFETRYNIQANIVIDEASNFATYDLDLFEQITYFSQQCLVDPRVLALTLYLWEDPTTNLNNIFNVWSQYILDLPGFTQRLAAQPDILPDPTLAVPEPASTSSTSPTLSTAPATPTFNGPDIRVRFEDNHIETMPLETYLRFVVPAEMPALWHPEAVKAQSVAARTFALKSMERARSRNQEADIFSSFTRSQQFDRSRVHSASDEAILATKGMIIRYKGAVIDALFSANCGGLTFNNEDVSGFSRTPIPYLRSVSCINPGPKNGHGVGMCQHGARAYAEQGWSFEQILAHYYQGAELDYIVYDKE